MPATGSKGGWRSCSQSHESAGENKMLCTNAPSIAVTETRQKSTIAIKTRLQINPGCGPAAGPFGSRFFRERAKV